MESKECTFVGIIYYHASVIMIELVLPHIIKYIAIGWLWTPALTQTLDLAMSHYLTVDDLTEPDQ